MDDIVKDHPNPTLARPGWVSLDGPWSFCLGAAGDDPLSLTYDGAIVVPFPPEAPASGVGVDLAEEPRYRRPFTHHPTPGGRTLLHCEGVDHRARVWVNGTLVGEHVGGYTSFALDVTHALAVRPDGVHDLVIAASDPADDQGIHRGKQTWAERPAEIWYRRSSGIWRSVWLEEVPVTRVEGVYWIAGTTTGRSGTQVPSGVLAGALTLAGTDAPAAGLEALSVRMRFRLGETLLAEMCVPVDGPEVGVEVDLAAGVPAAELSWEPEHPRLIDIDVALVRGAKTIDRVASYTGLRSVAAAGGAILINGRPVFQRLVLEQSYWPDTLYTAPDAAALHREARLIADLGFNGLRMHQVSADPRFLRACDERGLLVWADLPAAQTFGVHSVARAASLLAALVARDRNHPSVIAWVLYNESWGLPGLGRDDAQQLAVARLYRLARALDPARIVVGNDGWQHVAGDVVGVHDYAHRAGRLRRRYRRRRLFATLAGARPGDRWLLVGPAGRGRLRAAVDRFRLAGRLRRSATPVLLTEFGGVSLASTRSAWKGYGGVRTPGALVRRVAALVRAASSTALAGFCWTQLTDVEQEQNGLAWPDRTPKAPAGQIAAAIRGVPVVPAPRTPSAPAHLHRRSVS